MLNKKGQGSLEYLLLIGGAVLVAAIVIALVVSSSGAGADVTKCNTAKSLCSSKYFTSADCTTPAKTIAVQGTTYTCAWDSTKGACSNATGTGC